MPTYEYECTSCGQHIEVFQRFSEDALKTCGVCGGPLRKVFHPAGIVFKGSGFYATDSRSKRTGAKEGADGKKADAKSGSASDSKSDSTSGGDKGDKKEAGSSGTSDSKGDSKGESKKATG